MKQTNKKGNMPRRKRTVSAQKRRNRSTSVMKFLDEHSTKFNPISMTEGYEALAELERRGREGRTSEPRVKEKKEEKNKWAEEKKDE